MEQEFNSLLAIAAENIEGFSESKARKALEIMVKAYKKDGISLSYLNHNIGVAELIAKLKLGAEMVYAGLLHNAVKLNSDTQEIRKEFGEEVERLLIAKSRFVAALEGKKFQVGQYELVKVLFFSATKNINLTILQLTDKADELRKIDELISIGVRTQNDKKELIELAEKIYIPLTFKLGIYMLKDEFEDRVFEYTKKKEYEKLSSLISEHRNERMKDASSFVKAIESKLAKEGINARI